MSSPAGTGRKINEGAIRLRFEYAAGDLAGRAIRAARSRRVLLGSRCASCDRVLAPARSLCPRCGRQVGELIEIGPGGVIESWTELPGPGVFVLVRPDGADTSLAHRLVRPAVDLHPPRIGERVVAVFDESGLAGFTPIDTNTGETRS